MGIFHIVNKSPFTHGTLESCLSVCAADDSVLLYEDGVLGAIGHAPSTESLQRQMESGVKVYALINDIKARGLQERLLPDIICIDYVGFVQLSIDHPCVQSWY